MSEPGAWEPNQEVLREEVWVKDPYAGRGAPRKLRPGEEMKPGEIVYRRVQIYAGMKTEQWKKTRHKIARKALAVRESGDRIARKRLRVLIRAQPGPQEKLLSCPARIIVIGGARAGGKTMGVFLDWMQHLQRLGVSANGLVVRKKRTAAQDTIRDWQRLIRPTKGRWNSTTKEFIWPNGARLAWGYLDQDSDVDNFAGHNYTWIAIEEANQIGSWEAVFALFATLRGTAAADFDEDREERQDFRFLMTCNPGGPGSIWLRDTFVRPAPQGGKIIWLTEDLEGRKHHISACFIPARVTDNKILLKKNPQYLAQLLILTRANPALRRAWLEGDWDALSGQYFDNWYDWVNRGGRIRPFRIPDHWKRYISADWGGSRPFCFYWHAIAAESVRHRGHVIPQGAIVTYREWYGIATGPSGRVMPNKGLKLGANDAGRGVAERCVMGDAWSYPDPKIVDAVIDPGAFGRQDPQHSITRSLDQGAREWIAENEAAFRIPAWRPAQNTRTQRSTSADRGGWDEMRHRMDGVEVHGVRRPMLYVTENCTHFFRTCPELQHDPKNPEDVLKEEGVEDHSPEAMRYGIMREQGQPWAFHQAFKETGWEGIVTIGQLKRDADMVERGRKPSALGLPVGFLR